MIGNNANCPAGTTAQRDQNPESSDYSTICCPSGMSGQADYGVGAHVCCIDGKCLKISREKSFLMAI